MHVFLFLDEPRVTVRVRNSHIICREQRIKNGLEDGFCTNYVLSRNIHFLYVIIFLDSLLEGL